MNITKVRLIILVILGLVLVLSGGAFLAKDAIRGWVNGIRAERLQEKAQAAFEDERWEQASRQGQAAHYLDPDNTEILLLVARSTLKQRIGTTLGWWKLIVDEPDLPVEDLRLLTRILLSSGQLEDGLLFLNRLVELDPDDPETLRLWLQSLERQRQYPRAAELARNVAKSGIEDWGLHQFYMTLENQLVGAGGEAAVIEHLQTLMSAGGPLALNAARELALSPSVPAEIRLKASGYLAENGIFQLDKLYAWSVEVKEGTREEASLFPLLNEIVETAEEGDLTELLKWARFMNATDWFLENVSWEAFQENAEDIEPYLSLILDEGNNERLLALTERQYSQGQVEDAETLLYFRAVALENLGRKEEAQAALELALQTTDPSASNKLERLLLLNNRWDLLTRLYQLILSEEPGDQVVFKALAANYYIGRQEEVEDLLKGIDLDTYDDSPGQASFIHYLRLVTFGFDPKLHSHLEALLARYSKISDFRPVVGISYLLQGRTEIATDFLDGVPELEVNAPRYLRVATVLLGRPADDLMLPGEIEFLLPREKYLLSHYAARSTD